MSKIFEILMRSEIGEGRPRYELQYLTYGDDEAEEGYTPDHKHIDPELYCVNLEGNIERVPIEDGTTEFCVPMIKKEELTEAKLVECLLACLQIEHCVKSTLNNFIQDLGRCFNYVEEHELIVDNIVLNPKTQVKILDEFRRHNVETGIEDLKRGYMWGSRVNLSEFCPENKIVFVGNGDYVGVLPETDELMGCAILYPNHISYMEIVEAE